MNNSSNASSTLDVDLFAVPPTFEVGVVVAETLLDVVDVLVSLYSDGLKKLSKASFKSS